MATVLEPTTITVPDVVPADPVLRRPTNTEGFWGWITTVDHKRIGVLYGVTAFVFFLFGGVEAMLIRLQLAKPNATFLSADLYNQLFTMHGTTMIFLVVMPISAAFFNYFAPIMIGARDVAFPRLNALSYWTFLGGAIFINSSFLLGGAPNGGWFGYAPNTSIVFSPGHNIDFWILGLQILGIASTVGAVNLIVTILNMRAPGMELFRMPVFVWMTLVASFLLLFAMPIITVALFLLMFDRQFGANFFNPAAGGDPVLWQHLFWLFGHPEVYILILPSMGIVSEILPVFTRKPLFGYRVVVFSGIAIGFMGWGVWVHHMFAVGLGPWAVSAFSVSTMFIAVPTGVKIFNWLATCWKGSIKFATPMLFSIGFIVMFTIGGLSGVTHSISPHDRQQTDTYYVVAHFHYVLFGGALFGIMGGIYYWWPKMFGHMLNEKLGKLHFWLWFIGFNVTFGPFHLLGLQGMPRRIYTYDANMGFDFWNMVATVGVFVIAASVLVFLYNVARSRRFAVPAGPDPWDGRTLEWTIPSPTPVYNFAEVPTVHELDDFWHRKYGEDAEGRMVKLAPPVTEGSLDLHRDDVHLPSPSYFPVLVSLALPVMAYGMVYRTYVVVGLGALLLIGSLYAWGLEPATAPHDDHGHDVHDDDHSLASGSEPTAIAEADGPVALDAVAEPAPVEASTEAPVEAPVEASVETPVDPAAPAESAAPAEPAAPVEPVESAAPAEQIEPAEPTEASTEPPAEPTKPTEGTEGE